MVDTDALARLIAADIVRVADQHPAVRDAVTFSALHDVYDVNESVLAGLEAVGIPYVVDAENVEDVGASIAACNEATDLLDGLLADGGFNRLAAFAESQGVYVAKLEQRLREAIGRCKHCCNRRGGWCKGCRQDAELLGLIETDHPASRRGREA